MGKVKKFNNQFSFEELKTKLSNFEPYKAYSFSKRDNPSEFSDLQKFVPQSYVSDLNNKIQTVDLIYSGSTEQPFILWLMVGRLDKYKGQETYDYDFFHIAPESGSLDDYFMKQFIHIKDEEGNRISKVLYSSSFNNLIESENHLYNTYLTGSTTGYSFEKYEQEKPKFINVFKNSFK